MPCVRFFVEEFALNMVGLLKYVTKTSNIFVLVSVLPLSVYGPRYAVDEFVVDLCILLFGFKNSNICWLC